MFCSSEDIMIILLVSFLCWGILRIGKCWNLDKRQDKRVEVKFGYKGIPGVGFLTNFIGPDSRKKLTAIKAKYGDICKVRVGSFQCIWLNDYYVIKEAWTNSLLCGRPNMDGISLRTRGFKGGIIFNDGKDFTEQRRFVLHTLKSTGLGKKTTEQFILREIVHVISKLTKQEGSPISTQHFFNIPAFNIIWRTATGGSGFNHDDPKMSNLVEALNRNMALGDGASAAFFMPWLSRYFPRFIGWNNYIKDANYIFDFWTSFAEHAIKEYQSGMSEDEMSFQRNSVLWEYCHKIQNCEDPSSSFYGDRGVLSFATVLQDLFIAGSETTATTLRWIFLYLAAFPDCQRKIYQEIKLVLGEGSVLKTVSLNDRDNMPYTEAFIKESLRYSTLAPLGMLHCTMEDVDFQGYFIPKGTILQMNASAVHFDPKYWTNPEKFMPERFFTTDDPTKLVGGEIPGFVPFSLGKRLCPGAEVAKQTLFITTVCILQNFEVCAALNENAGGLELRHKIGVSAVPYPHKLLFMKRKTV